MSSTSRQPRSRLSRSIVCRCAARTLLLAAVLALPPGGAAGQPPADAADPNAVEADLWAIRELQLGHTDRAEEARILQILRNASGPELDQLVSRLELAPLFQDVDDHTLGPQNLTALVELLVSERLGDLSVASRAALLDAAQLEDTDEAPLRRLVLAVLLGTHGAALTELKNRVDAGNDHRDLMQLLDADLEDPAIEAQVLDHFRDEAHSMPVAGLKLLSDIDDTFYANWIDRSFPPKTVYPGVRQFYLELDRGAADAPDREGDLTFLTARPRDPLGAFEDQTHAMLHRLGAPPATVLTGDLTHLLDNASIAAKKLENFQQYRRLYPEYAFAFVGDSGQGDVEVARGMLEQAPQAVRATFIHDVVQTPPARRQEYAAQGIVYFDTYVGAGIAAFQKGLIQRQGLVRIARAALDDLNAVRFGSVDLYQARRRELHDDLVRLDELLPPSERLEP